MLTSARVSGRNNAEILAQFRALAAISHVFTIDYVAKLLGEDVEWLHELMEPKDGCLWVHGVGSKSKD